MKMLEIQVYYVVCVFMYLSLNGFEALQFFDSHFDTESVY